MIDAREVLKTLRLPIQDETEVQRIGGEIVAVLRGSNFDGTPVQIKIPVGETEEQQTRSFRIACAIQRRFQSKLWTVSLEPFYSESNGQPPVHRFHFMIDAVATRPESGRAADSPKAETLEKKNDLDEGRPFYLKNLHNELATLFSTSSGAAPVLPVSPDLSIIFGTYNRLSYLQRAVASMRKAIGDLSYEIVCVDGGSTDGSRAWLAAQPDVILIAEHRLEGAVRAFNQAYAMCRGEFIANFNDDAVYEGLVLYEGVKHLREHPQTGQVAFSFSGKGQTRRGINDIYSRKEFPRANWGTTYANFGVVRRSVADQVVYIQGGNFWNPTYRTYAADCEFSAWIWRLGHLVDKRPDLYVKDEWAEDELRERNVGGSAAEAKRMYARWPAEAFQPDGPEPRVSQEELSRYRELKAHGEGKKLSPAKAGGVVTPPDSMVSMAELCGFPFPQEETRLQRIGQAIQVLDPNPIGGKFPERAAKLNSERVLHVHLGTDADPQAGLVRAFETGFGSYRMIRWLDFDHEERQRQIINIAKEQEPTIVFMQLQTANVVDVETVRQIRRLANPSCVIATWCGDIAAENAISNIGWQIGLGRTVDLVLHSSMSHVRALRAAGCHNAGYLQIGYDQEQYRPAILNSEVAMDFDVSFLGSHYGGKDVFSKSIERHDGDLRYEVICEMRKAFGSRFGLFGNGWRVNELLNSEEQMVPLQKAHEIYCKSRIGLSISLANDLECYSSDRLLRILGCGSVLLTKRFPGMSVLGLKNDENCLIWDTTAEAVHLAKVYLALSKKSEIPAAGAKLAQENHTWDIRMKELQTYIDAVRSSRHAG